MAPPRLVLASALMVAIFLAGTIGYRLVEGATWWDAFFMTVITLTTVGYGEVFPLSRPGEVFTVVLLFAGLGMFLLLATDVARTVIEWEIRQVLGRARRSRMIEKMSNHEVVCGWGRMGRAVVDELRRGGREVVVVERNPERVQRLRDEGIPVVEGDTTSESALRGARIESAHGLVSCVNDDAHNVYTVLTARSLNPRLFIVARATEESAENRILQAGADRVVNPYHLGGTRLAHLMAKPAIVSFFDASLGKREDLQLDQVALGVNSPVAGRSLVDANLRKRWGVGVVAIQRGKDVISSPDAEFILKQGDVLVLFGSLQQIQAFEKENAGG
jgi:voltage-gated potassium channel